MPPSPRAAVPRTRFAPSPTGFLHLGHVLNAEWSWQLARRYGADVVLRIEDHDATRCRPEFEAAMLEDLIWLGYLDDGVRQEIETHPAEFRQSARGDVYEAALERLIAAGEAYVCECSRKDIAAVVGDTFGEETLYPGTCRAKKLVPGPGRGWRVRMDPGEECFVDLSRGELSQSPAEQCGDVLVKDRLGQWTYQFAVAVDDLAQQITLVVRGEDLLESTGRQLRLARLLGRQTMPSFVHHPLILKADGSKLSKSAGDTGVRELRAAGLSAQAVRDLAIRSAPPAHFPMA